jgi:uncharacterized membrane protein (Fun14 family)
MGLLDEIIHFITNGNIGGIPILGIMTIPFVLGLVVGFLAIKFLKIALFIILILAVVIYLGLYSLDVNTLHQLSLQYGPAALHLGSVLIGMLPLGLGFVIGAIVGFLLG